MSYAHMQIIDQKERILILDFGSQVTQLIGRRIRESGVYCEIWPYDSEIAEIKQFSPKGIILSGGPASVHDKDAPHIPQEVFEMDIPLLGICYGMQAMCYQLGGEVSSGSSREFGEAYVKIIENSLLFSSPWDVKSSQKVWMSHGDKVSRLPSGFETLGVSDGAPYAIIGHEKHHYYGVQFHPEVVHTPHGEILLKNFTHKICGCSGSWDMKHFKVWETQHLQKIVGKDHVICGLSGGVDSTVAAVMLHKAIGDQLTCIFIDNGLLRENEAQEVVKTFRERFSIKLVFRDASEFFLSQLKGVSDPERKRKIIGRLFIDVFEEEAKKLGGADFLGQGTLYPDVIESVRVKNSPSATIKSHHNVGGLPERMRMKLVEPLRHLFKDEVRSLGRELGVPEHMTGRHPFPGPGLAIRIMGEITPEKLKTLRQADRIFIEEIRKDGLYPKIWQAFVVLLPVKTVGVMGDRRTYENACVLRAITSVDGMTAAVYPFSMDFLTRVARRIVNEVHGINRVTYDITSKPPGTIEWE